MSEREFKADLTKVTEVLDNQIEKEIYSWPKMSELNNSDKENRLKNYKYRDNFMDNYGIPVLDKNNSLIGYKINEFEYISLITYYSENNLLCNKVSIKSFNLEKLSFEGDAITTWIDTRTNYGFIRELNKDKYYYDKDNCLINVEISYNQPKFPVFKYDSTLNEKIATIDFETYGTNLGLGHHQVYAAGFSIKGHTELFYIEPLENNEQFVNRFFHNIIMNHDLNDYTIYIHNLGRFDSLFILKSLALNKDINLIPVWKENSILSLTVNYLNSNLILLDSFQIIPDKLENILNSYNCKIKKGNFPYKFVDKKKLFYVGNKPSKEYYNKISNLEFDSIPDKNWDLKRETLKYLKSDVEGLLEAILKFRDNIHNKYNLNLTKYKTIAGLALAIYSSNYIPKELKPELKMVKGSLETKLRSSYFGGNVEVYINEISNAYYYDMNSQYPTAMLNDMPVGNPTLSLEKDLNKIFGFVYGEITPPGNEVLRVPFIQYRDPRTNLVYCPNNKINSFSRLIFSEEIKYAIKYGYEFKLDYAYTFNRGKDLFKDYVNDHFEIKKKGKDPVQINIAKLLLNSLYGRLGMSEKTEQLVIVNKESMELLDITFNVSIISELRNNKYLVKYNGELEPELIALYSNEISELNKNKKLKGDKAKLKKLGLIKGKSITSAVHIAAAISSYARVLINEYKNIPGNPCIMSDTDSAVLPYPLPDHLVGKEIGQMKLVHEIKKGIFIKKKLYCLINTNNQVIIKSSGVESKNLTYESFLRLLKGETIVIKGTNFNVEWKGLNINVVETSTKIHGLSGLSGKVKTIHNITDVNYKFISFPIKYNLIIHPMFPYLEPIVEPEKIIKKESDFFLIFSKLEIIFFIIFIIMFIIFISLYIFLFKTF